MIAVARPCSRARRTSSFAACCSAGFFFVTSFSVAVLAAPSPPSITQRVGPDSLPL